MNHKRKSNQELRKFGIVMAIPLTIIAALLFWKGRPAAPYFLGLAVLFLSSGMIAPRILAPVERIWMAFAGVLSVVMTFVILTLTYYIVITPMGLLLRLFGKDLLQLKFHADQKSYWIEVEPDGPCSRPDKPY